MSGAVCQPMASVPTSRLHVPDRRRAPRCAGSSLPGDLQVRVRAGHGAAIVDLSRHGILLESTTRLLPGQRYTLQWRGAGPTQHALGCVVRAEVAGVSESHGVYYRAALEFASPVEAFWEPLTLAGHSLHVLPHMAADGLGTLFSAGTGGLAQWRPAR